jgi:hypothetical protein
MTPQTRNSITTWQRKFLKTELSWWEKKWLATRKWNERSTRKWSHASHGTQNKVQWIWKYYVCIQEIKLVSHFFLEIYIFKLNCKIGQRHLSHSVCHWTQKNFSSNNVIIVSFLKFYTNVCDAN